MLPHRFRSRVAAVLCLALGLVAAWQSPHLLAAEDDKPGEKAAATAQPAGRELRVASIDGNAVFRGFKYGEEMQNQFVRLREEAMEASRTRDQGRMAVLTGQMQRLQMDLRKQMQEAITAVAEREKIDLVVNEFIYRGEEVDVPDISGLVVEELNRTAKPPTPLSDATTRPATTRPTLQLGNGPVRAPETNGAGQRSGTNE